MATATAMQCKHSPAKGWHTVASSEALDVLHRVMCPASYHRIPVVIKITSV